MQWNKPVIDSPDARASGGGHLADAGLGDGKGLTFTTVGDKVVDVTRLAIDNSTTIIRSAS